MGNKRLGTTRLEKVFESLARDLNMSGGTISGSPTTTLGATTLSSTLTYASGNKGVVIPLTVATPTALSAAGTLAKNTKYYCTDTDTAVYALPAAASSTVGDWIKVFYTADLANAATHDYGTSGEDFSNTSILFKASNGTKSHSWVVDTATTGDDYLKITGAANAGAGVGTTLEFVFNGTAWRVEAWVYAKGEGSTAVTAAFAATSG